MIIHFSNDKIYCIKDRIIIQYDVKYQNKCVFQLNEDYYWSKNSNQIFVYYHSKIIVIGQKSVSIEMNGRNRIRFFFGYAIDDNLLAYVYRQKAFIENFSTGTIKSSITPIDSFTLSQNGKHVLIYNYNYGSCIVPIRSFLKMNIGNLKWVTDNFGLHKILWEANKSVTYYEGVIKIINIETYDKTEISVNNYQIYVDADLLYIIAKDMVIVVDSFFGITKFRNEYGLIGYSTTYHIFVNKRFELFRIDNGVLKKYIMVYDFWRDVGIPLIVCYEVEILIDLELFPSELINEIYRQLVLS